MANLIPLSDIARDRNYDFRSEGIYDPTGHAAYGSDGKKIGTVRGAMVEPESGRLRYLIVDVGGWFVSKEVLVPVGLARLEEDAVYFDNLTKEQVRDMREYRYGEDYAYEHQVNDERVLRGAEYDDKAGYRNQQDLIPTDTDTTLTPHDRDMAGSRDLRETGTAEVGYNVETTRGMREDTAPAMGARMYNYRDDDEADTLFKTPDRLRLLEERLVVDKERYVAGSVEVGKHVETRPEQVNVNLSHEELVIERRPVTDGRVIEGGVKLGADGEVLRVDLEAERANVHKEAMVTEEVEVKERAVSETQSFTENVGREVLDVRETGDVKVSDGSVTGRADRVDGDVELRDGLDRDKR